MLLFEKPSGSYASHFRNYKIVFHSFETPENIIVTEANGNFAGQTIIKTTSIIKSFLKK